MERPLPEHRSQILVNKVKFLLPLQYSIMSQMLHPISLGSSLYLTSQLHADGKSQSIINKVKNSIPKTQILLLKFLVIDTTQ